MARDTRAAGAPSGEEEGSTGLHPQAPVDGDIVKFRVQVSNIASEISQRDLEDLLKTEKVEGDWQVKIHTGRHAFIFFDTKEFATGAIQKLENKSIKEMKLNISKKPIPEKYPKQAVTKVGPNDNVIPCEMADLPENIIDSQEEYITFIKQLRAILTNHKGRDDIFEYSRREEGPELAHPLLTEKPSGGNLLDMFIYIKIAVEKGSKEVPILAIQKDSVYIKGFMNKDYQWFELPAQDSNNKVQYLKEGLCAQRLQGWDETYGGTMKLERRYQVNNTLMSARFGRALAKRALRRLWNYDPKRNDDNPIRHGLAGLFVMISEAARMDPFLHTISGGWNGETGLTKELVEVIREWGSMSAALLKWRESSYRDWPSNWKYSLGYALASIRLVRVAKHVSGPATCVEIFSASAHPPAKIIEITGEGDVFPQDKAQGPKKMDQIHGTYISAHEWFCISVGYDDASTTREFKLSCSKQDIEPVTASFYRGGKKLDVTYLAMSDAVKATVNVNLLVPEGESKDTDKVPEKGRGVSGEQERKKYTLDGQISAIIGDYNEHNIMLLCSGEDCKTEEGKLTFQLQRGHVMVPRDKQLHINMNNLVVTDDSNIEEGVNIVYSNKLSFDFLSPTTAIPRDNSKVVRVGVDISWDTDIIWDPETDKNKFYKWTIGDSGSFTKLIQELRTDIGANANVNKVFDIPVLKRYASVPDQWTIHIKVQAEGEKSSITLAIRDDKLIAAGFRNQAGVWYSLTFRTGEKMLGPKYNSIPLDWGRTYKDLLQGTDMKDHMKELGKEFAVKAVRTLSRYPDVEDEDKPRLALLGLVVMVCDAPIWEPVKTCIAQAWDRKACDTTEEEEKLKALLYCIGHWDIVSHALLCGEVPGERKETVCQDLSKKFATEGILDAQNTIQGIQLVFDCHLKYQPAQ